MATSLAAKEKKRSKHRQALNRYVTMIIVVGVYRENAKCFYVFFLFFCLDLSLSFDVIWRGLSAPQIPPVVVQHWIGVHGRLDPVSSHDAEHRAAHPRLPH